MKPDQPTIAHLHSFTQCLPLYESHPIEVNDANSLTESMVKSIGAKAAAPYLYRFKKIEAMFDYKIKRQAADATLMEFLREIGHENIANAWYQITEKL